MVGMVMELCTLRLKLLLHLVCMILLYHVTFDPISLKYIRICINILILKAPLVSLMV